MVYVEIIKQTEAAIYVYQHGQGLKAYKNAKPYLLPRQ